MFMLLIFVELPDVAAEAAADKKVVINTLAILRSHRASMNAFPWASSGRSLSLLAASVSSAP